MIKALLFDVDGTLLAKGENKIPASAVEAILKCREKGMKIIIATGRNVAVLQEDVKISLKPDYFISSNGACINDSQYKALYSNPMTMQQIEKLMEICEENDWPYAFKFPSDMRCYYHYDEFVRQYCHDAIKPEWIIDDSKTKDHHLQELPLDCFIYSPGRIALETIKSQLDGLNYSNAYNDGGECYSATTNKGLMAKKLFEILQIDPEEAMAFGDGDNDIELLKMCGIGVCMGNGIEATKQVADYVSDDVYHDGIAKAIKHYGLI